MPSFLFVKEIEDFPNRKKRLAIYMNYISHPILSIITAFKCAILRKKIQLTQMGFINIKMTSKVSSSITIVQTDSRKIQNRGQKKVVKLLKWFYRFPTKSEYDFRFFNCPLLRWCQHQDKIRGYSVMQDANMRIVRHSKKKIISFPVLTSFLFHYQCILNCLLKNKSLPNAT